MGAVARHRKTKNLPRMNTDKHGLTGKSYQRDIEVWLNLCVAQFSVAHGSVLRLRCFLGGGLGRAGRQFISPQKAETACRRIAEVNGLTDA